ncbi:hypothetical protein DM02DRAFT_734545 [Periconia macrospinosa]|uniref:C2H2-type domain-containing protein n=1 Tax=Periconia macrospinosa TaxID=97972 RepID=A0A2V1CYF5_9PLEO|nr:hypothetical protein DM02DRAFT_734545 [Periconia macrospinosa]
MPDRYEATAEACNVLKYKVLVCLEHTTGIQNLNSHLRDYHAVPAKERKAIVEKYSWAAIETADQVRLPAPMGRPIQELGEPIRGLQCAEGDCDYISINQGVFRKHCKKEHGLQWVGDTGDLYTNVNVQTFFRTGGLQRYFVVRAPDNDGNHSTPAEVRDEVDRLLVSWRETKRVEEEKAQIMDAEAAKQDKTGWFSRTGWLEHLAKRNYMHLAHAAAMPTRDEPKLKQARRLVELLVERSVTGLSTLARETRRWLRVLSARRLSNDQWHVFKIQRVKPAMLDTWSELAVIHIYS